MAKSDIGPADSLLHSLGEARGCIWLQEFIKISIQSLKGIWFHRAAAFTKVAVFKDDEGLVRPCPILMILEEQNRIEVWLTMLLYFKYDTLRWVPSLICRRDGISCNFAEPTGRRSSPKLSRANQLLASVEIIRRSPREIDGDARTCPCINSTIRNRIVASSKNQRRDNKHGCEYKKKESKKEKNEDFDY